FGQHRAGAHSWPSHAANIEIGELLFERLRFGVVEFAIEIDAKRAGFVARRGDVSPEFRRHGALGDNAISLRGPAIDPEMAPIKIEVRPAGPAENAIIVADAGIEANPGFD